MIRIGCCYSFGEMEFVVLKQETYWSPSGTSSGPGFCLLVLNGFFKHSPWPKTEITQPGGTFVVAKGSAIACDSKPL